ncbi:MAG: ATP-binding protein, partial [Acidimicrobiales bacterium]
LRGMFDGPSTVPLTFDGPGLVLDLSAVYGNRDALPLVMVAAAAWLRELMACDGPQRIQILDEAWALLGHTHTAAYLQECWKLGRAKGIANIGVLHRTSDLGAQADDGTALAKIASGLLADSATKIILGQDPKELAGAADSFGLTDAEIELVGHLHPARALWKIGGHTAVVQHLLAPSEVALCDTDQKMIVRRDTQPDAA